MMRNPDLVRRFEDELKRRSPPDYAANLAIFEAMWAFARSLGVLPPADPLEGIDTDIRLAEALNVRKASREDRAGP
jgi:hypothetical protein